MRSRICIIENQPETGKKKIDDLKNQEGIAVFVHIQCSGSTHGTGKKMVKRICRINEQEQGYQLKTECIVEDRRDEICSLFKPKLDIASASEIPSPEDAESPVP